MLRHLLVAGVALGAAPSFAAEWVYVATGADQAVYYLDTARVTKGNRGTRFWMKVDYTRVAAEKARTSVVLDEVNCEDRTVGPLAHYKYSPEGSVIFSWSQRAIYAVHEPVPPDSVIEAFVERLCGV